MKIFRRVAPGESLPNGLYTREDRIGSAYGLMLPIWLWRGMHYDMLWDQYRYGWRILKVMVQIDFRGHGVADVRFARGWLLLKETHAVEGGGPPGWYRNGELKRGARI